MRELSRHRTNPVVLASLVSFLIKNRKAQEAVSAVYWDEIERDVAKQYRDRKNDLEDFL